MTPSDQKHEPWFQRNVWVLLLIVASIFALFGIGDIIRGMDADPAIIESILGTDWESLKDTDPTLANMVNLMARAQGASIAVLSILSAAIIVGPFRRGEPWAWYVLWLWPLWNLSIFITFFTADRSPDFATPPPMLSSPIFFTLTALALIVSYRKFFPRS